MWSGVYFPTLNLFLVLVSWKSFLFQELLEHTRGAGESVPTSETSSRPQQLWNIGTALINFQISPEWAPVTGLYLHSGFTHQFCFISICMVELFKTKQKELSGAIKAQPSAFSHTSAMQAAPGEPSSSFHSFSFPLLVAAEGGSMPLVSGHDKNCAFWPWYWQLGCFSCVVSTSFVKSATIIPWQSLWERQQLEKKAKWVHLIERKHFKYWTISSNWFNIFSFVQFSICLGT